MKKNRNVLTGCLCALGCEILFGFSYFFTRQVTQTVDVFDLLGWRFPVAFIVMTLCVMTGKIKIRLKGKNSLPLLKIAFFSPVLYFIGETVGISNTSASESGILLACIPVVSLLFSALILKKKPSKLQLTGILVTLIGVTFTVVAAGASASLSVPGHLFLLMAVVSYALYSVYAEKAEGFTGAEITYVMLAAGAAVFVTVAIVRGILRNTLAAWLKLPFTDMSFLTAILYQGIGCSILAFFLSNTAIAKIGVNRTSSFIGVSTVVSLLAGTLLLKETLLSLQWVGAAVILAGIYIANAGKAGDTP